VSADGDILLIAAGGGGDALASLMVAEALGVRAAGVATFAWERKMFDPRPGPREPGDFRRLGRHGKVNWQVGAESSLAEGHSFLPTLAAHTDVPLFLMDPRRGGAGLRRQLAELVEITGAGRAVVVDVGGDILARGDEPGLRSPLADALALAAAEGLPEIELVCLGLGLDGELGADEWEPLLGEALDDRRLPWALADRYRRHFAWHPSEATAMACLAALGYRGTVEMRSEGLTVRLDEAGSRIYQFDYARVRRRSALAEAVADTRSLAEAERAVREVCGVSELEYERRAASRHEEPGRPAPAESLLAEHHAALLTYGEEAADRGVQYLTMRRVAEVLGLGSTELTAFRRFLERRDRVDPDLPVWSCRHHRHRPTP
jgi:hypothetical protein